MVNNVVSQISYQDERTETRRISKLCFYCPTQGKISKLCLYCPTQGKIAGDLSTVSELASSENSAKPLLPDQNAQDLTPQMLSMACHEFRSSLTVIAATNDLLKLHSQKMTADQRHKYFQKITDTVKSTAELIEGFLAVSKADSNHKLNLGWIDFPKFSQEVWQDVQQITGSEHRFIFTNHWGLKAVLADSILLRQILVNLLLNAVKYSANTPTICCEFSGDDRSYIFNVTDRGIGIPPEDIETLFQPFQRAKNTGKAKGTGLGLTIVKRAVELHGGKIYLESEVGVGTTFTVTLPRLLPMVETNHSHCRDF